MVRVVVVGAGAVGLSTAVNIQSLIPDADVTIIADKFGNETTSSGAGGLFRPSVPHIKGVPVDTIRRWSVLSWKHYSNLALSIEGSTSGNNITNGFIMLDSDEEMIIGEMVFSYHKMSPVEMQRIRSERKYGYNVTTVITEPKKYLPWLMRRFKANGGKVIRKKLGRLDELCGQFDVIANCCGLDALNLLGDTDVHPVRGQVLKMRAPWLKEFFYNEHDGKSTYVIPHQDLVVVGGCRIVNDFSLDVDPSMTEDILRRAREVVPGFGKAVLVDQWVGLRPTRTPIRVEKETMSFGGRKLQVVHNYGHGAHGITLSWGTGVEAAQMVKEIAERVPPRPSL